MIPAAMPSVLIYDAGDSVADRYTVFILCPEYADCAAPGFIPCLGVDASGGRYFSQFSDGTPGDHCGRLIGWDELPTATAAHIVDRLTT